MLGAPVAHMHFWVDGAFTHIQFSETLRWLTPTIRLFHDHGDSPMHRELLDGRSLQPDVRLLGGHGRYRLLCVRIARTW